MQRSIDERIHGIGRWLEVGDVAAARRELAALAAEQGEAAELPWLEALVALEEGKVVLAEASALEGVERAPESLDAQFTLGAVLAAQEKWPEAIARFDRLLADHPDCLPARQQLCYAMIEAGQGAAAIQLLEQGVRFGITFDQLAAARERVATRGVQEGRIEWSHPRASCMPSASTSP